MSRLLLPLVGLSVVCLLSLVHVTLAQQLGELLPSTLYDFESPVGSYSYTPPVTAVQPWSWPPGQGGTAAQNSPFDPPPGNVPAPHNVQYAFIQTSPSNALNKRTAYMGAVLTGLSTTAAYFVTFSIGVRLGGANGEVEPNRTLSTVYLTYGNQSIWQSVANISDSYGWLAVVTSTFTPTTTSAAFNFTVISLEDRDHSILIDAVTINPTIPPPNATLSVGVTSTFDNPVIAGQYDYTTPTSSIQPWVWTQGGRAAVGSPFDPPPPTAPPSGSQYAFLQTSPNANAAINQSTMSAVCSGLSRTQSYQITYYWAVRRATSGSNEPEGGNQTQSQLSVLVDGATIYVSPQNLSDAAGWAYVQTPSFVPVSANNGSSVITFLIASTSNHDHTLLFDNITVSLNGSVVAPGSSNSSSSSTGSAARSSSSSGSSSSVSSTPLPPVSNSTSSSATTSSSSVSASSRSSSSSSSSAGVAATSSSSPTSARSSSSSVSASSSSPSTAAPAGFVTSSSSSSSSSYSTTADSSSSAVSATSTPPVINANHASAAHSTLALTLTAAVAALVAVLIL